MNKANLFFQTLTPEILCPIDYTDWKIIKSKVKTIRREIALLQSLDKDDPVSDLAELLIKEPKILNVLQLLIAHTPKEIYFDDLKKHIHFKKDITEVAENPKRAKEVALIFVEMGLVDFLKEVKSVEDVIKGVLVGLEPNTRKNRRGTKFEMVIESLISKTIEKLNIEKGLYLSFNTQMYVDLKNERKEIDYVVLQDNKQKIGIEVNFYSTSGSKPSEVLGRAYPEVQNNLENQNIGFIVITDGFGWTKMKPVIQTAFDKLHYLMNIKQAKSGELENAILEILNSHRF